jgi:hypothetical protein
MDDPFIGTNKDTKKLKEYARVERRLTHLHPTSHNTPESQMFSPPSDFLDNVSDFYIERVFKFWKVAFKFIPFQTRPRQI